MVIFIPCKRPKNIKDIENISYHYQGNIHQQSQEISGGYHLSCGCGIGTINCLKPWDAARYSDQQFHPIILDKKTAC